jgi:hypothetical protein
MLTLDAPPLTLAADDDGVIRVGGTRVSLATVITAYHQGATPEEIVDDFDTLDNDCSPDVRSSRSRCFAFSRMRTSQEAHLRPCPRRPARAGCH